MYKKKLRAEQSGFLSRGTYIYHSGCWRDRIMQPATQNVKPNQVSQLEDNNTSMPQETH